MKNSPSQKRVVNFLFGLRKSAPIMCNAMFVSQIAFAVLVAAIAPIYVSQLLTNIANGSATFENSLNLLIIYTVILIIGNVIMPRVAILMAFKSETKMQIDVSRKIFDHLSAKSLNFHANRMSGGLVSDSNKLLGSIERFWDNIIFNITPTVSIIISVCISLCFIMWQYAILLFVLSAIISFIIIKAQGFITPVSQKVSEKSSAMTAFLADVIMNISAVKAFAKEKSESLKQQKILSEWRDMLMIEMKRVFYVSGLSSILMVSLNFAAFLAAIFATENHLINVGVIYLMISYTISISNQLWSISNATRQYVRIIGDASPMIATLDEEIELNDPIKPEKVKINKGKIEFKNIRFTHSGSLSPLFNNFTVSIKPGERIGLVGRSGSGKTSLTKLLLRFSDIDRGEITIDGQNIARIKQSDLHENIAYVPQEPLLFHRTLRENIAYAKPEASDEEVLRAAKNANALEFIENLPQGLDTIVGERGVKLSGGQRQRVAIARALLKNAPILLLDEATSALDSESEKLIQDALIKLMKDRTSIVIAHRLSTIAKLDRIIVLENGQIIEQGSHESLIKQNGAYAKLWARQSGGFIEE